MRGPRVMNSTVSPQRNASNEPDDAQAAAARKCPAVPAGRFLDRGSSATEKQCPSGRTLGHPRIQRDRKAEAMKSSGVTPEELLRDFRILFESQTRTLRALATASNVGVETIRGWKDEGRFPRSTDDFIRVIRTCLKSLKKDAPNPAWRAEEWEIRYQEAKRIWENQAGDRHSSKPIPVLPGRPPLPSVQVYGGDYVAESKNAVHIGDVNHYVDPPKQ
jgi:hypothetical protein